MLADEAEARVSDLVDEGIRQKRRANEAKTREAALRAGIERLHTEDGAGDCRRCGYESGWPCETATLLDGEARP